MNTKPMTIKECVLNTIGQRQINPEGYIIQNKTQVEIKECIQIFIKRFKEIYSVDLDHSYRNASIDMLCENMIKELIEDIKYKAYLSLRNEETEAKLYNLINEDCAGELFEKIKVYNYINETITYTNLLDELTNDERLVVLSINYILYYMILLKENILKNLETNELEGDVMKIPNPCSGKDKLYRKRPIETLYKKLIEIEQEAKS